MSRVPATPGGGVALHLAQATAQTATASLHGDACSAAHGLLDLIEVLAPAPSLLDPARLKVVRPAASPRPFSARTAVERRTHSVAFNIETAAVDVPSDLTAGVIHRLQQTLDLAAIDHPRAACRVLRETLPLLRAADPALAGVDARGERID
jgi:hypothetical protein